MSLIALGSGGKRGTQKARRKCAPFKQVMQFLGQGGGQGRRKEKGEVGGDLRSRRATPPVPSAQVGLTAGFEM